jgi:putative oxidoreductase
MNKLLSSNAPPATIIIRLMVGLVFLSEGIQKFLFPQDLGVGRFIKLGIPSPEFFAPFTGSFEIACGILLLLGLFTRLAVVPLLAVMAVAFLTTRLPDFAKSGFWGGLHGGRTDWSMTMGLLFLLMVGSGPWSLDAVLQRKEKS